MRSALVLLLAVFVSGCHLNQMPPAPSSVSADDVPIQAHLGEGGLRATATVDQDVGLTYGTYSRARSDQLADSIGAIMASTLPAVREIYSDIDAAVAALRPPETLSTVEVGLRDWGKPERLVFQEHVDEVYAGAAVQLDSIYDLAMATATSRALGIASVRSPLDRGVTGDPALDDVLVAFEESMRGMVGFDQLDDLRTEDRGIRTEVIQVFTSFGAEEAEEAMGGRLLLFVGGDETFGRPRCILAFRSDDGTPLSERHLAQVMRHRIMRGNTVVQDLGWRALPTGGVPGVPSTREYGSYLLAESVEPIFDTEAPSFAQLASMRILVDIQSGVFDASGAFLGAVDWRVIFYVSSRGDLTWELSTIDPRWDPYGTELQRVLKG